VDSVDAAIRVPRTRREEHRFRLACGADRAMAEAEDLASPQMAALNRLHRLVLVVPAGRAGLGRRRPDAEA
jgi:hypothetical protein